ncbi:unnamed protein product [Tilletia controversa]|nr:unnamed protein product [Tilletia controversa]
MDPQAPAPLSLGGQTRTTLSDGMIEGIPGLGNHPLTAEAPPNGSGTAMPPPPAPNPVQQPPPPPTFQEINAQPLQAIALAASSVNNPTGLTEPPPPTAPTNEGGDGPREETTLHQLGLRDHSISLDLSRDPDASHAGPSSQRRPRESGSVSNGDDDADASRSRAAAKRARMSVATEEHFEGPINIHKNGGLFSTAFNPYAMPDLDVLATHWSTAARAALRGRVIGLMRFFRIAGYLPPPAKGDGEAERESRKAQRVSRGYESWKCRACGTVLNPVCGETGNARKHISLGKCSGLFSPLESALLFDQDEEVRGILQGSGARVMNSDGSPVAPLAPTQTQPGASTAADAGATNGVPPPGSWFELAAVSAAEAERNAAMGILPAGDGGMNPGAGASSIKGGGTDANAGDTSSSSLSQTPIYSQQADGSVILVGHNQSSGALPSSSSSPSNNVLGPSAIVIGPAFRAPSALAVASYFVATGQPPEHADSLAWRYLFDGVPGMPSALAIREAMRGTQHVQQQ